MADTIRVGIIGANPDRSWAMRAHVPALASLPQYTLQAVSTSRRESADAAAAKFNAPLAFDNHEELVAHPDVDLVVVSVKVPYHHELVLAALGGLIFCNRLCLTARQAIIQKTAAKQDRRPTATHVKGSRLGRQWFAT